MKPEFILASNSPRRRELLSMLGIRFRVLVSDCDETISQPLPPDELVRELALRKAAAVAATLEEKQDFIVLGADTIVWNQGRALGKPRDLDDARATLFSLSGHAHSVYTGISLIGNIGGRRHTISDAVSTEVVFDTLSPEELSWYLSTGEASDKAGSYAIQGAAGCFITELRGDYYTVVGLPIARLRTLLKEEFGLSLGDLAVER